MTIARDGREGGFLRGRCIADTILKNGVLISLGLYDSSIDR